MSSKIGTVNVIEIPDKYTMAIHQLASYNDDEDGNADAEKFFRKLVAENSETISDEDLEIALEDGYWEEGSYYVCIVHSTGF